MERVCESAAGDDWMKIVKLAEVVKQLESGSRPKGGVSSETGTIPSLGAEHLSETGQIEFKNKKFVNEDFYKKLKNGKVIPNDILIVKDGATTGKVAIFSRSFPYKNVAINEHVFKISINEKIAYPLFIYCFLKSTYGKKQILNDFRGATVGGISRQFVDLVKIPIPPLDDQKRIAHLLGKVEGMIARRKQHLQQLDELLKSVFLEMFGDPVRNEKGWEKKEFEYFLKEIQSGKSPVCEARQSQGYEWGVLKLGAVTKCVYDDSQNKALLDLSSVRESDEVQKGDILFTRKNTYELVAACAYVFETKPKLLIPDLVFRFILKDNVGLNSLFLWKLLVNDSQRKKIQSLAGGAAGSMPNISKTNLKKVLLPYPPITLQNQFAAIVEKVESLKSRYQSSLSNLENLYGVLSQKAFNGELDLSRVPMEEETR